MENLRSFLFERHSLETICEKCLGIATISNDIKDRLLEKSQDFLPGDLLLKGYQSSENNTQEFSDELLLQAEVLIQSGDHKKAESFEILAIRWSLVPHLMKGRESTHQEMTQNCLGTLEEIEKKKIGLKENYLGIRTLIQNVVPKRTSTEKLDQCVEYVFLNIQNTLEANLSEKQFDFRLHLRNALDNGLSRAHRKASIWTHKTCQGIHFIYVPDPVDHHPREDSLDETMATEVFVSKLTSVANRFFAARRSRVFLYKEETIQDLQQERSFHERLLNLPQAKKFFAPLPLTYETYVAKAPGFESFQEDLRFTHFLPVGKFLEVFEGVIGGLQLLESHNYVSCDIKNENIVFKREGDSVFGMIDHCMNIGLIGSQVFQSKAKRLNALAQNGYVFFETHRYALVIAIAEAFFVNLEKDLPLDKAECEGHAVNRLKKIVYERHYIKVKDLKRDHNGFCGGFSQDLLDYVTKIAREGEEGLQLVLLEQFAFKMKVFPEITSLFLRTMEADELHRQFLNSGVSYEQILNAEPRIPSLDQIQEVLKRAKDSLKVLCLNKEKTNIREISLDQMSEIVTMLLNEEIAGGDLRVEILMHIVNDVLKESPSVGSEVRIHKNKLWKDTGLMSPFSLWICVQADNLRLEFFDPNQRGVSKVGGNKKVKAGMQVDISVGGALQYTPIVISRIKRGALDWPSRLALGNKIQEKILEIPGAENYFLSLSRKHRPHFVGHKRKLELTSLRFEDSLSGAIEKNELKTKGGIVYLSKHDYIGFLQNIGKGIKLLKDQGISHGDMKVENIAIDSTKQGLRALIFDHDFSGDFHRFDPPDSYLFWNSLRQKWGFVSEETDLYGYVLIIAEVLLQDFASYKPSETKENRVLRFETIARKPIEEKNWMQERIETDILEMCPAISQELVAFFSIPLHVRNAYDIPQAFFDFIRNLEEGDFERVALEHSIVELLILDPVFDLLATTFRADQNSMTKMQENLLTTGDKKHSALQALKDANFPTAEEIEKILALCEEVSNVVDRRLHQLFAIEPVTAQAR
jgi:serine/threonine protein kinase